MSALTEVQDWLDAELSALVRRYDVPGGAVGVLAGGEIAEAAAGVLNLGTGVPAGPDSLFQIGSVTKLWTTVLVMQLVEEDEVELDEPVARYLPGFRVADPEASAAVTVRHLLTHTSGIYGDAFVPTSRDEDAVARYVDEVLPTLPQDLAPGEGMSYSNSAFAVLGRIAEVLRGKPFPQLLRERIAEPLGLHRWAATPEDALLHSAALGHMPGPDGRPRPAPFWNLPASLGPAGTILATAPRELLAFAAAHLDGDRLLAPETVARMWQPQVELPDIGILGDRWGLGWMLLDWDGHRVAGHDGGTYGQSCCLRLLPEAGIAIATHANGGQTMAFHRAVIGHVVHELAGVRLPALDVPPEEPEPVDAARFAGRYDSATTAVEITAGPGGTARLRTEARTPEARTLQPEPEDLELVRLDADRLIATHPRFGVHEVLAFPGSEPDRPAPHLFRGGRLTRRSA